MFKLAIVNGCFVLIKTGTLDPIVPVSVGSSLQVLIACFESISTTCVSLHLVFPCFFYYLTAAMATITREATDPSIYKQHHQRFSNEGQPSDEAGWVSRAAEVSKILAEDAAARDIANKSPKAEVALLKSAGLLKVLGPTKYGGGGQTWETGYKVIREVAKSDGSLGMLLGYHLLWSTTANVVGSDEQKEHLQQIIIENNYFVGGAVNPRDSDLKITSEGDHLIFNGFKNFNTGGVVSDLTVLEGVYDGTDAHIFTFVKTEQPGIQFAHNWDNMGLRLTESGSVRIDNIRVPWSDALGWDVSKKAPDPAVLGIIFSSLLLPTIQLVFSNFYLGIALGSLDAAAQYTRKSTRAWPFGGDNKESATEEWYILEKYGTFRAHLDAAEALANKAGAAVAGLYTDALAASGGSASTNGHSSHANGTNGVNGTNDPNGTNGTHTSDQWAATVEGRASITPERRGNVAATVATVKVVTTDTGLLVTSGVFEMLGSKATAKKANFDRFWRDIRTHSLHDPVAYKRREVGRWTLVGEIPEPTWYT